jgi:hypothetical protein
MPYDIIKRSCKQSDGSKGTHVVVKKQADGKTEQVSCHTSEEKAKSAVRAKHAHEGKTMKITRKQLSQMIKEEKNKLLKEGFLITDLISDAAKALSAGEAGTLEGLAVKISDALMPENELRAWENLFDAMIDAAYAVEERDDPSGY